MRSVIIPFLVVITLLLNGCSLLGIHLEMHNPRRSGKYPGLTEAARLRGTLTKYRSCYDVKHYDINISIFPESRSVKGYVDIHAEAVADLDTLQVDLYPNLKISSIEVNGVNAGFKRREGAVFIAVGGQMKKGSKLVMRVNYEGEPTVAKRPPWAGGMVWKKDKNGNPWIGVACEGDGASLWWPTKDHLSDEADSTAINITAPAGLMVVANGRLRDSIPNGNEVTYKWFVSYPINNYNITFYAGDLVKLHDTYQSKVNGRTLDLDHYVLSYNYEKAKKHFEQLKPQLDFYEKYFGEYPWYRDGYKLVESPFAGMEHQSAIAYGNGYKNGYNGFDYIILHETAHEWWGNSVTAFDLAHVWIHEGFATYCEALYVEQAKGHNAYMSYLRTQAITIKNKRPVVGPEGYHYFNYKDGDVYNKGSWILHTLRLTLNDDSLFFDILKTFSVAYREKQVVSQDFIDLVNGKTGKDYTWFFEQYLYKRKIPVLEFYWSDNGDLYYRWTGVNENFKMPLEVTVNKRVRFTISPSTAVAKTRIPVEHVNDATVIDFADGLFIEKRVYSISEVTR